MPIDIYEIENLFWDNNSYGVPNAIPTVFKNQRLKCKCIPEIIDFFGGTIRLKGGNWNWCKYKGEYYFLKKKVALNNAENLPIEKQTGLYDMVKCIGTNSVLAKGIRVTGDVIVSDNEELLAKNLNKCLVALTTPAQIIRVPLSKKEHDGRYDIVYHAPEKTIYEYLLATNELEAFRIHLDKVKEKYKAFHNYWFSDKAQIFILGAIRPTVTTEGGKNLIKERIKSFCENISPESIKLVQIGTGVGEASANRIFNKYALSPKKAKSGDVGKEVTAYKINKIDLSGLTDIIPIRFDNLQKAAPNKKLTDASILIKGIEHKERQPILKVFRKIYLPHLYSTRNRFSGYCEKTPFGRPMTSEEGNKATSDKYYQRIFTPGDVNPSNIPESEGTNYMIGRYETQAWSTFEQDEYESNERLVKLDGTRGVYSNGGDSRGLIEHPIQYVRFKPKQEDVIAENYLNIEEGYLWYVDKVDFVLQGNTRTKRKSDPLGHVEWYFLYQDLPDDGEAYLSDNYGFKDTFAILTPGSRILAQPLRLPHYVFEENDGANHEGKGRWLGERFGGRNNNLPSYGMLLYQIQKTGSEGNTFEYLGEQTITKLKYYSGFNKELKEKYGKGTYHGFGHIYTTKFNNLSSLHTGKEGGTLASFYLDLDKLLIKYFLPTFYGYYDYLWEDYDYGGLKNLLGPVSHSKGTSLQIYRRLKNGDESPFIDPIKYKVYADGKRKEKIDSVTIKDDIELNFKVEKGDYLFHSLEHDLYFLSPSSIILDYNVSNTAAYSFKGTKYPNSNRIRKDIALLSDAGMSGAGHVRAFEDNELYYALGIYDGVPRPTVVLSTNRETGGLELRVLEFQNIEQKLDNSDNNIVAYVNESKKYKSTIFKLGAGRFVNAEGKLESNSAEDEGAEVKQRALRLFFSVYHGGDYNNVTGYTEEDLDSPEGQYLFDLVGTDGYALIKNGDLHLVLKESDNNPAIEQVKISTNIIASLDTEEVSELKNKPLLSKINQLVTLHHKTHVSPLKGRFLYEPSDKLRVEIVGLGKADQFASMSDHFLLKYKTDGDESSEMMTITKRPATQQVTLIDQIELDKYRLYLQRADEDRKLQQLEHEDFAKRKIDITYDRNIWDLNYEWSSSLMDAISTTTITAASFAAGTGGAAGKLASGKLKGIARTAHKVGMGKKTFNSLMDIGTGIAGSVMNMAWRDPEMRRRALEDKQLKYEEVKYASFKFDRDHFRRKQDKIMEMNNRSRVILRESVNDIVLAEKMQETINMPDTYLTVRIPSDEQLKYVQAYVKEYGVDCEIPNVSIAFADGMKPGIIRFRNLNHTSIFGLDSLLEREILKARFHTGLKIIQTGSVRPVIDISTEHYKRQNDLLNRQLSDARQQLDAEHKELEKTQEELEILKGEEAHRHLIEKHEKELEEQIKKCVNDVAGKEEEILKLRGINEQTENNLKAKEQELKDQKGLTENYKQEALAEKTEKEEKIKELGEATKKLETTEADLNSEKEKLKTCENTLSELNNKVGELEKEKIRLETQIAQKEIELNTEKDKHGETTKKHTELDKFKKQLEEELQNVKASLKACTEAKNQLENDKKGIEATLKAKEEANKQLQEQVQKKEQELEAKKAEASGYAQSLTQREQELRNANLELDKKKKELEQKSNEASAYMKELTTKENELQTCEQKLKDAENKSTSLEQELHEKLDEITELQKKYDDSEKERDKDHSQLEQLNEEIKKCKAEIAEYEKSKTASGDLIKENEDLKKKLQAAEQKYKDKPSYNISFPVSGQCDTDKPTLIIYKTDDEALKKQLEEIGKKQSAEAEKIQQNYHTLSESFRKKEQELTQQKNLVNLYRGEATKAKKDLENQKGQTIRYQQEANVQRLEKEAKQKELEKTEKEKDAAKRDAEYVRSGYNDLQDKIRALETSRDGIIPQYWGWEDYRRKFPKTATELKGGINTPSDEYLDFMYRHKFGLTLAEWTLKGFTIEFLGTVLKNQYATGELEAKCKKMIACIIQSMICRRQQNPFLGSERCKNIPKGAYERRKLPGISRGSLAINIDDMYAFMTNNTYFLEILKNLGTDDYGGYYRDAGSYWIEFNKKGTRFRAMRERYLKKEYGQFNDDGKTYGRYPTIGVFSDEGIGYYIVQTFACQIRKYGNKKSTNPDEGENTEFRKFLVDGFNKAGLDDIDLDADIKEAEKKNKEEERKRVQAEQKIKVAKIRKYYNIPDLASIDTTDATINPVDRATTVDDGLQKGPAPSRTSRSNWEKANDDAKLKFLQEQLPPETYKILKELRDEILKGITSVYEFDDSRRNKRSVLRLNKKDYKLPPFDLGDAKELTERESKLFDGIKHDGPYPDGPIGDITEEKGTELGSEDKLQILKQHLDSKTYQKVLSDFNKACTKAYTHA